MRLESTKGNKRTQFKNVMNRSNHTSESESDEDYICDGDNETHGRSDDTNDSASDDPEDSNNKQRGNNFKQKNYPIDKVSISAPRQTRQSVASKNSKFSEKEELQSDEEADKARSDTLWADFLCDVDSKRIAETETSSDKATCNSVHVNSNALELSHASTEKSSDAKYTDARVCAPKRPAESSSVSAVLGRFKKKTKMSVLEKSKVDWKNFKTDEGIDDELRAHNRGKDGYLERQDFLQRTDLRQFEIEKQFRKSSRQN